jgi:hypothetical protein
VRERDDGWHLATGAGAPADPESGPAVIDEPVVGPVVPAGTVDAATPPPQSEVVQAVVDFVKELVDDAGTGNGTGAADGDGIRDVARSGDGVGDGG